MASYKGRHEYERAMSVARRVVEALEPHCERIEVCGSLRRRRLIVGDVDVIAVPKAQGGALEAIKRLGGSAVNVTGWLLLDGVSVDIGFVPGEAWGAALCHSTGPKEENIRLRAIARAKGLKLSQKGLVTRGKGEMVAGATEEEVYAALGEPYVPPEWRDVSSGRISRGENEAVLARFAEVT
jgi:DNA polymerase (family 10)